jgi:hypothetical protein
MLVGEEQQSQRSLSGSKKNQETQSGKEREKQDGLHSGK